MSYITGRRGEQEEREPESLVSAEGSESHRELLLYADDTTLLLIKHLANVTQAQKTHR